MASVKEGKVPPTGLPIPRSGQEALLEWPESAVAVERVLAAGRAASRAHGWVSPSLCQGSPRTSWAGQAKVGNLLACTPAFLLHTEPQARGGAGQAVGPPCPPSFPPSPWPFDDCCQPASLPSLCQPPTIMAVSVPPPQGPQASESLCPSSQAAAAGTLHPSPSCPPFHPASRPPPSMELQLPAWAKAAATAH